MVELLTFAGYSVLLLIVGMTLGAMSERNRD